MIGRGKLQEYNQLNQEIAEAMSSVNIGEEPDEAELLAELDDIQQQELEDKMLKTGPVPVLPSVANGESESASGQAYQPHAVALHVLTEFSVKGKAPAVAEDDEAEELKKLEAEMAL